MWIAPETCGNHWLKSLRISCIRKYPEFIQQFPKDLQMRPTIFAERFFYPLYLCKKKCHCDCSHDTIVICNSLGRGANLGLGGGVNSTSNVSWP